MSQVSGTRLIRDASGLTLLEAASPVLYVREGHLVVEVLEADYWQCGCSIELADGGSMLARHSNELKACPQCKCEKVE